jgi:hypothetical protein
MPPLHWSLQVPPIPSSQAVPLALIGLEQIPVAGAHIPAVWHWSRAVHTTFDGAFPQAPPWQVSPIVHPSLSLQIVPLALFGFEHIPVPVLQMPTLWHWSRAVQTVAAPLEQDPFWQVSPLVQPLLSLHIVPLAVFGFEHTPVDVLQTPMSWHWSKAVQVTVDDGLPQAPFWQVSPDVQALLSLQGVLLALIGLEQTPVPGLHTPALWHWSKAVQTVAAPPGQDPFWQVSPLVQALLSLHPVPLALLGCVQDPAEHMSCVQKIPSSAQGVPSGCPPQAPQSAPELQTPLPLQVSTQVKGFPSSQSVPLPLLV